MATINGTNQSQVFNQMRANISGMQRVDPRTYEAMRLMIDEMEDLFIQINPLTAFISRPPITFTPETPLNFTNQVLYTSVQLSWSQTANAATYEVRKGTSWETASFVLRMVSLAANILPLPIGSHTYLLKAISLDGTYSTGFATTVVNITGPGGVVPSAQVVDNNVLLTWPKSTSQFQIDYYIVDRNETVIGNIYGTFTAIFESKSGSYAYGVTPVDIAGNVGPRNTVTATVNQPPDFVLEASYTSDLSGTKVNTQKTVDSKLLACVNLQTWAQHFEVNGWTTIKQQRDAGFPLYAQPMRLDGSYEETHDFGILIENTVVAISYSSDQVVPYVNVTIKIATSLDGITYTPFVTANSVFADAVRYVRFRLEFTTVDYRMVASFFNVIISLSTKRELDSGRANVFAADNPAGGTQVFFTKPFKDVESITLTVEGTTDLTAVYNFVDIPNPTFFRVLVFTQTGTPTSATVSWKARGIL